MSKPKKTLKNIKSGTLSRTLSLARMGIGTGAKWAGQAVTGMLADEKVKKHLYDEFLSDRIERFTKELGQLKGSLMKAGQLLSTYGEHFLPPQANEVLKTLQFQSPPLDYDRIYEILVNEFGIRHLEELDIEEEAFASASIGQVHRATIKATGEQLALKVQYPGVNKAVDSDLKALRSLLNMANIIPKSVSTDSLFAEVRDMLVQELNYPIEQQLTKEYQQKAKDLEGVKVPSIYDRYSGQQVIATEFIDGCVLDDPKVLALSQERRNRLGTIFLELYFYELFHWGMVQTDPHFGNYRVLIDDEGGLDTLVTLDFGAVRKVDDGFKIPYIKMVGSLAKNDMKGFMAAASELGFIRDGDPEQLQSLFKDFCMMIVEPFEEDHQPYDWGVSRLPSRVLEKGRELILGFRLRTPPRELVFLDRKLGGVFTVLAKLDVKIPAREILFRHI